MMFGYAMPYTSLSCSFTGTAQCSHLTELSLTWALQEIVLPAPCDHGTRKGCCIPCYMQPLKISEFRTDPYQRKWLVPKLPTGRPGLRGDALYDDTNVYYRPWSRQNKHHLVDPECNPKPSRRPRLRVKRYNRQEGISINDSHTEGLNADPPSTVICDWDKHVQELAEERRKSKDRMVTKPAKEMDRFRFHLLINMLLLFPALCYFSFYVLAPLPHHIQTFSLFIKGIFGV